MLGLLAAISLGANGFIWAAVGRIDRELLDREHRITANETLILTMASRLNRIEDKVDELLERQRAWHRGLRR